MATKNNARPTKVEDAKPSRFTEIKAGAAAALASEGAKTAGQVAVGCAALGLLVFTGKLAWDAADRLL